MKEKKIIGRGRLNKLCYVIWIKLNKTGEWKGYRTS